MWSGLNPVGCGEGVQRRGKYLQRNLPQSQANRARVAARRRLDHGNHWQNGVNGNGGLRFDLRIRQAAPAAALSRRVTALRKIIGRRTIPSFRMPRRIGAGTVIVALGRLLMAMAFTARHRVDVRGISANRGGGKSQHTRKQDKRQNLAPTMPPRRAGVRSSHQRKSTRR